MTEDERSQNDQSPANLRERYDKAMAEIVRHKAVAVAVASELAGAEEDDFGWVIDEAVEQLQAAFGFDLAAPASTLSATEQEMVVRAALGQDVGKPAQGPIWVVLRRALDLAEGLRPVPSYAAQHANVVSAIQAALKEAEAE